ncbi:hypothetical protein [Nocardia anaemiae]|uniref:hypothetical protein n=1 Tax=Nocardia anaemiae TaxID=263910 RepID=UPI0012F5160B|nr:hypothetical protein [Nocardia anaemiae]
MKRHLLRFGGMQLGDPLPGPLWLTESGAWEQTPGITPGTVVKSSLGDAALPVTRAARLTDGSTDQGVSTSRLTAATRTIVATKMSHTR